MVTQPIEDIVPYIQYDGEAGQDTFDFPWWIREATDLEVYLGEELMSGSDYSVTGVKETDGGQVILATPLQADATVTILSNFPYERLTGFATSGSLRAAALNLELSYLVACFLQLARDTNRKLGLKKTSKLNPANFTLEDPSADAVLAWDGTSGKIKNGPTILQIANAQQYAEQAQEAAESIAAATGDFTVLAAGTTTLRSLADRFSDGSRTFNVRDFGAVGDGSTNDRAAIQAALDKGGQTYPVTVIIPAGRYKIGTDQPTGVGQEVPLFYYSNTTIIIEGELLHYTNNNSSANFVLGPNYYAESPAPATRLKNVHILFRGNGKIVFPARTLSQSRKGLGIYWTDFFTLDGFATEGTDFGNYNLTVLNSTNGVISNVNIQGGGTTGAGTAEGEDGVHLVGACSNIAVVGGVINAGDAAIALTCESSNQSNMDMNNILFANLVCKTIETAAFDFSFVDINFNPSPPQNSVIRDVTVSGCHFGLQTKGYTAGLIGQVWNRDPALGNSIRNIRFNGCTADATGMADSTDTPAVLVQSATDVDMGNFSLRNYPRTGFNFQQCTRCGLNQGHRVLDYTGQATTVSGLTISSISYVSNGVMRVQYSGTPNLSGVNTSNDYVNISGAANAINNGRFKVSSIAGAASYYLDVTSPAIRDNTTDESGLSLTSQTVVRRSGAAGVRIIGGEGNFVRGGYIRNPASRGISVELAAAGTPLEPTNTRIEDTVFEGVTQRECIRTAASLYGQIINNRMYNCSAIYAIKEDNNSANENNEFSGNSDSGSSRCKQSFEFARASSVHTGNRGSNSDAVTGTISVASGDTSAAVTIPLSAYPEFSSANMGVKNMMITPNSSLGSATMFRLTASGRTFTVTLDAAPGSQVDFTYWLRSV